MGQRYRMMIALCTVLGGGNTAVAMAEFAEAFHINC
jgi:hypothetical protein